MTSKQPRKTVQIHMTHPVDQLYIKLGVHRFVLVESRNTYHENSYENLKLVFISNSEAIPISPEDEDTMMMDGRGCS